MSREKTIVLGIDSASWNYIAPLLKKGELPNLNKMIRNGISGTLKSTIPPFSPVAWTSFLTGVFPDKHGIFDWSKVGVENFKSKRISSKDRKAKPFWYYLNNYGIKVGAFNIPLTFPAEKIDGFIVSGFDSPDDSPLKYYPREVYDMIVKLYGSDLYVLPFSLVKTKEDRLKYLSFYKEFTEKQVFASFKLIDQFDIDVFVLNFSIIDHFNHIIKEYPIIEEGFKIVDLHIGKFLDKYPDANFIIMSDHGASRIKGGFNIIQWLKDHDYMKISEKKQEFMKLNTIVRHLFTKKLNLNGNSEKILRRLLLIPFQMFPLSVVSKLRSILTKNNSLRYLPQAAINFKESKIFYCSPGSNGLYFNRSTKNFLNEEKLINDLLSIYEPESKTLLIKKIHRKKELFSGELTNYAPDIILELSESYIIWIYEFINNKNDGKCFFNCDEINYYGKHTEEGIFVFYGKDFNTKSKTNLLNIVDIPAILLYLNNVPLPDIFDGKLNKEMFLKEFEIKNTFTQNIPLPNKDKKNEKNTTVKTAEEDIEKKLSDLGYM